MKKIIAAMAIVVALVIGNNFGSAQDKKTESFPEMIVLRVDTGPTSDSMGALLQQKGGAWRVYLRRIKSEDLGIIRCLSKGDVVRIFYDDSERHNSGWRVWDPKIC